MQIPLSNRCLGVRSRAFGLAGSAETQVFVSGEEHVESNFFRNLQQLTVGQRVPSLGLGFLDRVRLQRKSNPSGRAVIKQDEHLGAGGSFQAARSEIEHGVDLLAGYVELLHDFFDGQTVFEILEDSCDGQASAAENPGAAHFAGDAFHSRAS